MTQRRPGKSVRGRRCPTRLHGCAALAAAFIWVSATGATAANFRGLPTGVGFDAPIVARINANGDQLVGSATPPPGGSAATAASVWEEDRHTFAQAGPTLVGTLGTLATGQETSLDGNVRRTVGWSSPTGGAPDVIFIREENSAMATDVTTLLPAHPTPTASNFSIDISRDGHVLGRYTDAGSTHSFFYDPTGGTHTDLVDFDAVDMDAGGTTVVGNGLSGLHADQAVVWTASTGTLETIGPLAGGSAASAFGISASGRIVVGDSESDAVGGGALREAFRWHPDLGMRPLEPIPPGESRESRALATSDANIVVGQYFDVNAADDRAFIWTPRNGRQDLKSYLEQTHGLIGELLGWTLLAATAISADGTIIAGTGINGSAEPQAWVVDLTDENVAEIRVRTVSAPSQYEFYLECGDEALSEVFFGVIPSEPFLYDGTFDFAGCLNQTTIGGQPALDCLGASGLGGTVSSNSYVILPQETDDVPVENIRAAAFYFGLSGNGGSGNNLLCEAGDAEVLLGSFEIDQPLAVLEPTTSPYAFSLGRNASGDNLPDENFRLVKEPTIGFEPILTRIRPALADPFGTDWTVTLEADPEFAKFSFGITLPPQAVLSASSFGACNESLGLTQNRRGCLDGTLLGPHVDFSAVRTIGPDPSLVAFGMRPDTLYVYLEGMLAGSGAQPQMNQPGQEQVLGVFRFEEYISPDPGFIPVITYEGVENFDTAWNDAEDWEDKDTIDFSGLVLSSGSGWGPSTGPDEDMDGWEDAVDLCVYVPSNQGDGGSIQRFDGATEIWEAAWPDTVGNECQCGESEDNESVVELDVNLLRDILANPELHTSMSPAAKERCNSVGPVDPAIDSLTQLPYDCDINDVFVLLRARAALPPLVSAPLEAPSCPDVTTQ